MSVSHDDIDRQWMRQALALAERALHNHNEIPVGALVVDAAGKGIGGVRLVQDHWLVRAILEKQMTTACRSHRPQIPRFSTPD